MQRPSANSSFRALEWIIELHIFSFAWHHHMAQLSFAFFIPKCSYLHLMLQWNNLCTSCIHGLALIISSSRKSVPLCKSVATLVIFQDLCQMQSHCMIVQLQLGRKYGQRNQGIKAVAVLLTTIASDIWEITAAYHPHNFRLWGHGSLGSQRVTFSPGNTIKVTLNQLRFLFYYFYFYFT